MNIDVKAGREADECDAMRLSSGSGRKLRAHGKRTRELVVQEAKKVLLEGGTLEFSLRTVARQAKISISNLQYYFPTRASLLRAIMEPIVARYVAKIGSGVADEKTARETLMSVLNDNLNDVRDPEVSAIWLHFASLALTDSDSARVLDMAHEEVLPNLARLIRAAHPSVSAKDSRMLASLITAMVDGLVFQIGAGHRLNRSVAGIDKHLRDVVTLLIDSYRGSPRKASE